MNGQISINQNYFQENNSPLPSPFRKKSSLEALGQGELFESNMQVDPFDVDFGTVCQAHSPEAPIIEATLVSCGVSVVTKC